MYRQFTKNSTGKLTQKLVRIFNTYIRLRDKNEPCISCGSYNELQAGHYYPAGHYSWLRFNEDNVNHQCKRCNYFLSGNQAQYRIGLIKKIGEERVKNLELKAQLRQVDRKARFDLELMIELYKEKIKRMK